MTITDFDIDGLGLSEVDQCILKLNHEGLSIKEISISLKTRYGIELSKSAVAYHLAELRQDPDNDVRVNNECTVPRQPRQATRWYKIIERLAEAISDYERVHGFKPSSRTMYYQLIDEKMLTGSDSDHTKFTDSTVKARLGWVDSDGELLFPKIDIDCFADDDSRLVSDNYQDYPPTEPTEPGPIEDPEVYITRHISTLKSLVIAYDGIGEYGERGSPGGRWYDQPEYVEVWEEKNDLLPGFKTMLFDKHIKIRSNKGYPSLVFLYKCIEELKELIERTGMDPENIHIKYCGDLDPSGENIDWYIKKRLKQLGLEGVDFQRIAVTPEQIEEFDLPLLDIEKKPDKKAPNPNLREFVRRYGYKATHLNAFFTEKHLTAFKKILENAVDEHWDPDIYQEMVDEYDVDPDVPEELDDEELMEDRNLMCKKITMEFKPGWVKDAYDPSLGLADDVDGEV
jgi:hypothetical protein